MKVTFRFGAQIKDCDKQLSDEPGFRPGEVAFREVIYTIEREEEMKSAMFVKALMEAQQEVLEDAFEATFELIEIDGQPV